jgi:hypothetical protein
VRLVIDGDRVTCRHSSVGRAASESVSVYTARMVERRRRAGARRAALRTPAARLREAERLFADFVELTPRPFTPLVKTFDSFAEYERWKRAQTDPWYR